MSTSSLILSYQYDNFVVEQFRNFIPLFCYFYSALSIPFRFCHIKEISEIILKNDNLYNCLLSNDIVYLRTGRRN